MMADPARKKQVYPEKFLKRMSGLLGTGYESFAACLQSPPVTGLRVNTLKLSPQEFITLAQFKVQSVPWCPSGFSLDENSLLVSPVRPGKHPYHLAGMYYLQDPSAMLAAEVLAPQPGEVVLDLAAAPGGKATHMAALMNNTGLLVVNEIHPRRVWDLAENLERCGVRNAIIISESSQRLSARFPEYFDRVLLDAPCSGEGMFRKNPSARAEWKPDLVNSCAVRQSAILEEAARMVRPGGRLVYTTCTFSLEENEQVIANFLEQHPEFDLTPIDLLPGFTRSNPGWIGLEPTHPLYRAVRLYPHLVQGEGHFFALLVKTSKESLNANQYRKSHPSSRTNRKPLEKGSFKDVFQQFSGATLNLPFDVDQIFLRGTYVYYAESDLPDLDGLRVIHPAWWLGTLHKERFIPSHSLAMGITRHQSKHVLPFSPDDERLSIYLAGGIIPDPGENGWVLVTVDGFPIGWGKRSVNVVKNFYPRGLRLQGR